MDVNGLWDVHEHSLSFYFFSSSLFFWSSVTWLTPTPTSLCHQVLEPATSEVPLLSLALANRHYGTAPHVPYVIGVDASVWFEQCQQQMWYRGHTPAVVKIHRSVPPSSV
ncbi:hypothetical protein PAXRUDRAFT_22813 [Paxillus rubicundulus Ve08.2h10]|uniref:Uncharacterized protein n=1 Tax=Paxillus rubicundulus Ve08.2h10 TaxID=930991 RepID=A0A0D0C831_9AGAM|nr:hypothetical protein PAXRUDRAFT_22813 [Paxillus rubicundulus Ve08.2h10]